MAQAFFGGVHPNDMKAATNEKAIEKLAAPAEVVIPMSMHIGAPCKPIVAVGDKVTIGQKIGEPGGFVSAPIHASVSGTVKAVEPRPFSMGGTMMSVVIENDFQNTVCPDIHPVADPDSLTPEQLVEIVKNAGIVGQGGATFPTHVKISSGLGKVDYVIINAAECEPYVTADYRLLLERSDKILLTAHTLARALGAQRAVLVTEGDKLKAVEAVERRLRRSSGKVELRTVGTRYPLGAERQIVQTVTGREVPPGKLPVDVKCVVLNVATVFAIQEALFQGRALTHRAVTVSGGAVARPRNLWVPLGTPLKDLLDSVGGLREQADQVLLGGPMMGLPLDDLAAPVTKGTNALTCLTRSERRGSGEQTVCVRCGKCVSACPMHLAPAFIHRALEQDQPRKLPVLHPQDCISCGCCSFVCPARIPLLEQVERAKALVSEGGEPT